MERSSSEGRVLNVFLVALTVGAIVAACWQVGDQRWLARGTHWGYAPGWQREIGLWNIAIAALLLQVTLWGDVATKRLVVRTGVLLLVMLGRNHVVSLARQGGRHMYGSLIAIAFTMGTAGLGLVALQRSREPAVRKESP
jgi:hypothetical protein